MLLFHLRISSRILFLNLSTYILLLKNNANDFPMPFHAKKKIYIFNELLYVALSYIKCFPTKLKVFFFYEILLVSIFFYKKRINPKFSIPKKRRVLKIIQLSNITITYFFKG